MSVLTAVASLFGIGTGSAVNGKNGETAGPRPIPSILVIDDDPEFLKTMRILLSGAGYSVLTASAGPKGLDMLRYGTRDLALVLLDFNMPRFNGEETLDHLRRLNGKVRVIGVSGLNENDLPKNFQRRLDRFVAKPFNNGDLLQTIEDVLGRNPAAEPVGSASA